MLSMDSRALRISLLIAAAALVAFSWSLDASVEAANRGPIKILSDSDFTSANGVVSGNGSVYDPYIISDWSISSSGPDICIWISGTSKHFIIRNVSINSHSAGNAIFISEVEGGLMENISLENYMGSHSVRMLEVSNLTIRNLTAYRGWIIRLMSSVDILLEDVDLTKGGSEIVILNCRRCELVRCEVTGHPSEEGFDIVNSDYISLVNCTSRLCGTGVLLTNSKHCSFIGCVIEDNTYADLHARSSVYTTRVNQTRFGRAGLVHSSCSFSEIDRASTVDGKPIVFYANKTDVSVDSDVGQVILYNCTNVRISNMTTNGTRRPILMINCDRTSFSDLHLHGAEITIDAKDCRNTIIRESYLNFSLNWDSPFHGVRLLSMENLTMNTVDLNGRGPGLHIAGTSGRSTPSFVHLINVTTEVINGTSIEVVDSNSTVVEGCTVRYNNREYGIAIYDAVTLVVSNCTIHNFRNGIYVRGSGSYLVRDNLVYDGWLGSIGIYIYAEGATVTNNTVSDCGSSGITTHRYGKGHIIVNNTVKRCNSGIALGSADTICANNTVMECYRGIYVLGANCTIRDCTVGDSSGYGMEVIWDYSNVINCTISNASIAGIWAHGGGDDINITGCFIERCRVGIYLGHYYVTVTLNTIENCSSYGVLTVTGGNTIYWNTFIMNNYDHEQSTYNGPQANQGDTGNAWDNGVEGNLWSDYRIRYPHAVTVDGKVWNIPYDLGWRDDRYPLATPVDLVPPVAVAGDDLTVPQNTTVTFDGTDSSDDVAIYRWAWVFIYGGEEQNLSEGQVNFTFDIVGAYHVTFTVWDRFGNDDSDSLTVTVLDTIPPVPDVGPPVSANIGDYFNLNASRAWDNVGIVSYQWTLDPGGLNVVRNVVTFSYRIDIPGDYIAILNVSDSAGNWALGYLTIIVLDNIPPVADAGKDLEVDQGVEMSFDGTGSSDNIGVVAYQWTVEIGGPPVQLSGPSPNYTFNEAGIYNVTLMVTDGRGLTDSAELIVTVRDTEPPVAIASEDVTIIEGGIASLHGRGSTDNVGIVAYRWMYEVDGIPFERTGLEVDLELQSAGTFNIVLRVEDDEGNWGEDIVIVTVTDITRPTADAGGDRTVAQSEETLFDGGNSTDNVGVVQFEWSIEDMDETVTLVGKIMLYTFDTPGVFRVTLTVSDAAGLPDLTTILVTVVDTTPPVADAGENATILVASTHKLDGSISTDNVGIVRYRWTFTYKGKAEELTGARPSFLFDKAGAVEIGLEVEDGAGNKAFDTVWVTVRPEVVEWAIGPFVDGDGEVVKGAKVTVLIAGTEYKAETDENGWARTEVKWVDLQSPANVTVSKSGWEKLTFDIDLDEERNPTGDIPPMMKKKAEDSPGAGIALAVLALLVSFVAVGRRRAK